MYWQYDQQPGWSSKDENQNTGGGQGVVENKEEGQQSAWQQPGERYWRADKEHWDAEKDHWGAEKQQGGEWASWGDWKKWKYKEVQGEQRTKTDENPRGWGQVELQWENVYDREIPYRQIPMSHKGKSGEKR